MNNRRQQTWVYALSRFRI